MRDMTEEKERLLHEIHKIGEEYYSVEPGSSGVSFYEYLARRLCEIGEIQYWKDKNYHLGQESRE